MSYDQERVSLWLNDILEHLGVSEEERKTIRIAETRHEIINTLLADRLCNMSNYIFGSRMEGTVSPDLVYDDDVMFCNEHLPVSEFLSDLTSKKYGTLMLLANSKHQGYVKLQFVRNGTPLYQDDIQTLDPLIRQCIKIDDDRKLIWSDDHNLFQFFKHGCVRQGPSATKYHNGLVKIDHVPSLRCKRWPSVAEEWITRHRPFNWPSRNTVKKFKKMGCFLVPVGHTSSAEKHLEHRLSFSLQERELMFGLNTTQFRCYVMLKLIKKDILEPKLGDIISSYHCKTALFYTIEKTETTVWHLCNLIKCIFLCLEQLLEWVAEMNCPNYFIPGENMFNGKVSGSNRQDVTDAIKDVLNCGFQFLKQINSAQINTYFINKRTIIESDRIERSIKNLKATDQLVLASFLCNFRNCLYEIYIQEVQSQELMTYYENLYGYIICLYYDINRLLSIKTVTEHTEDETRDVVILLVPFFRHTFGSNIACLLQKDNDNMVNLIIHLIAKDQFILGLDSDLTSGRLKYATYLFYIQSYEECDNALREISRKISNEHMTSCPCRPTKPALTRQTVHMVTKKLNLLEDMKTSTCICLTFLPSEYVLVPPPLQFEYYRWFGLKSRTPDWQKWYDWVVIDSIPYFHFLKYLLALEQNRPKSERMSIIHSGVKSLDENLQHFETVLNVLSWMYANEGDVPKAFNYLCKSMKYPTHIYDERKKVWYQIPNLYNAAKWHILILLFGLWFRKKNTNFCFECLAINEGNLIQCMYCQVSRYCSFRCLITYWPKQIL